MALDIVCFPATCPACLCDFMCYECCDGIVEASTPGCCTSCARDCVPCAFIPDFPHRTHALRAHEWCQGHVVPRFLSIAVMEPCIIPIWACGAFCG
ncbi:hypothetical protein C8R43DRAFT_987268 [Mycena crocata]|nr:hypothetical protein C8R43DRAFT_987268 [Mycena crocata]